MVTNDIVDLFLIPLSTYLSSNVWALLVGTGIYLVPFILILLICVGEARAAGADEGTPAIQAFRKYETSVYGMLLVLLIAANPISNKGVSYKDISVKQYSCVENNLGLIGLSEDAMKTNPVVMSIPESGTTLWQGIMSTFSTGMTNSLINGLPCEKDEYYGGFRRAMTELTNTKIEDSNANYLANQFYRQCHKPAVLRAINISQLTDEYGEDIKDISLGGKGVEIGMNGVNIEGYNEPLKASVNSETYGGGGFWDKSQEVECSQLESDIKNLVKEQTQTGSVKEAISRLNGIYANENDPQSQEKYIDLIYNNTMNVYLRREMMLNQRSGFTSGSYGPIGDLPWQARGDTLRMDSELKREIAKLGADVDALLESPKVLVYQIVAPLVIGIIKLCLVATVPLLLFLTGYTRKMLFIVTIGYVGVEFAKFFFELGVVVDEALSSFMLINTSYNSLEEQALRDVTDSVLGLIGQLSNYTLVAVWFVICGWMGTKIQTINAMADSAGSGVKQFSGKAFSVAYNTGAKISNAAMTRIWKGPIGKNGQRTGGLNGAVGRYGAKMFNGTLSMFTRFGKDRMNGNNQGKSSSQTKQSAGTKNDHGESAKEGDNINTSEKKNARDQ